MNKKGSITDNILTILIVFLVFICIIGGIYLFSLASPLIFGTGGQIVNNIKQFTDKSGNSELINATNTATDITTGIIGVMPMIVYIIFIGFFIGFIFVAYETKTHPSMAFIWIGLMFLAVIFSIFLSNSYQEAKAQPSTAAFYSTWGTSGFIMEYLPHIVTAFGLITGALLFFFINRLPEEEIGGNNYV